MNSNGLTHKAHTHTDTHAHELYSWGLTQDLIPTSVAATTLCPQSFADSVLQRASDSLIIVFAVETGKKKYLTWTGQ